MDANSSSEKIDDDSYDDNSITIRTNGESLRRSRKLSTKRTETAVVSEMFAFLSNPDEEYQEDQPAGKKVNGKESSADVVEKQHFDFNSVFDHPNGIFSKKNQDSGFASLERHVNGDMHHLSYDNFIDTDDLRCGALNVCEQRHPNGVTSNAGWMDASNPNTCGISPIVSLDGVEYDDLDVAALKLGGSQFEPGMADGGCILFPHDSSNETNDTSNVGTQNALTENILLISTKKHSEEDRYNHTDSSCSQKPVATAHVGEDKSLKQNFITVDFAKSNKGSKVVVDKPRDANMVDSYYDFISSNSGDNVNDQVAPLSSDDDEDDCSLSVPVPSAGASEQDYDNINFPESEDSQSNPNAPSSSLDDAETANSDSVKRRTKMEKNPSAEEFSEDSSDEDIGVYAESFRRSHWIRASQEGKLKLVESAKFSPQLYPSINSKASGSDSVDIGDVVSPKDEVFVDPLTQLANGEGLYHKRSDSVTTTKSEREFKNHYVSRRKCLIQRADSQQEYHRQSARMYDQDKLVFIERQNEGEDLGLHLLSSHPAFITSIDPDSLAAKAGVTEGQILVSVNDHKVLTMDHQDIIQLIHTSKGNITLGVASSDFQPVRDLQAAIMSGFMLKLGNSTFMKMWKKRYFILRQDNCLYYYKNDQDTDPLGAIPLCGYTISRHTDTSRDFCFKAEKYGARTYYFMTDSRDLMTGWVRALTEAAARSKKRKESFLSVSSHNVSLPALDIRNPECTGFLGKLSPSRRHWRRRYCILKDACVYYYKDMSSFSALGVAHLHGYKVDVEGLPRRKYSFSLQPPEIKMRTFIFTADNETDKKRWVEFLIHSIQRWILAEGEC